MPWRHIDCAGWASIYYLDMMLKYIFIYNNADISDNYNDMGTSYVMFSQLSTSITTTYITPSHNYRELCNSPWSANGCLFLLLSFHSACVCIYSCHYLLGREIQMFVFGIYYIYEFTPTLICTPVEWVNHIEFIYWHTWIDFIHIINILRDHEPEESYFRTSKMAAETKWSSVSIWNGHKCDRKWISNIQNGRSIWNGQKCDRKWHIFGHPKWPFCQKLKKKKFHEMARNSIKVIFEHPKLPPAAIWSNI